MRIPPIASGREVVAAAKMAPVPVWHRARSVSAERATRPVSIAGSVRLSTHCDQEAPESARRWASGSGWAAISRVPQRSSSITGRSRPGSTTARADSCGPSDVMPQRIPGDRSTIGSEVPITARPSATGWSRIATWPNSGRGANSTNAFADPLITLIRSVRYGSVW